MQIKPQIFTLKVKKLPFYIFVEKKINSFSHYTISIADFEIYVANFEI